jgi:general secretion pathway protein N
MTQANRPRGTMLTRLLLVPCLILGPLIYVEWDQQGAGSPDVVVASDAPATPAARPIVAPQDPGFAMPPLENYNEVLARPPFSESRRPAPAGAMAKAIDQPLTATVIGTILAAGSVRALVEHGEPPLVTRVVEGQELDGWTVKTILQEKIVLVRAGAMVELKVKGGTPTTSSEPSMQSPTMPSANVGTQRLTKAGALPSPLPPASNAAIRRSPQLGATAAVAAVPSDAMASQVVNSPILASPSLGGSSRGSIRRR